MEVEAAAQQQNPEPKDRNETDEDESVDSFDYFACPQSQDMHMFFSYHPQQTPNIAIPKVFNSKDGTNRKWLTYSEKNQSLYCSVCLAFAPLVTDGPFIKRGMKDWKHIHQRIMEHEKSKTHRDSADAYSECTKGRCEKPVDWQPNFIAC